MKIRKYIKINWIYYLLRSYWDMTYCVKYDLKIVLKL